MSNRTPLPSTIIQSRQPDPAPSERRRYGVGNLSRQPVLVAGSVDEPTRRPLAALLNFARLAAESAATGDEDELAAFAEAVARLEAYRDYVAAAQHANGKTWGAIGAAFGMSKQAARARWSSTPLVEPWPARRPRARDARGRFVRSENE